MKIYQNSSTTLVDLVSTTDFKATLGEINILCSSMYARELDTVTASSVDWFERVELDSDALPNIIPATA